MNINDRYELNDSINNYAYLFKEYINNQPTLSEALYQMYDSEISEKNQIDETVNDILYKAQNGVRQNFCKIKEKYDNITKEDAYIICSYTIESLYHQFSPYKILNKCLMGDDLLSGLKKVSKYLYILLITLRKLPRSYYDELYRGIRIKSFANKSEGDKISFLGFISTATEKRTAMLFLGKSGGTFFKYKGKIWGYDITLFSYFQEKEIILEPERVFIIEKINSTGDVTNIECKMEETALILENIKDESDKDKKIKKLEKELTEAKNMINKQKIEIEELNKKLKEKKENQNNITINALKKEIEKLKEKLEKAKNNNPNNILIPKGKMECINFTSTDQKINYAIPCSGNDVFAEVEEKLYQEYPEYRETNNNFLANGVLIKRFKTVSENKIGNGKPVLLTVPE